MNGVTFTVKEFENNTENNQKTEILFEYHA